MNGIFYATNNLGDVAPDACSQNWNSFMRDDYAELLHIING